MSEKAGLSISDFVEEDAKRLKELLAQRAQLEVQIKEVEEKYRRGLAYLECKFPDIASKLKEEVMGELKGEEVEVLGKAVFLEDLVDEIFAKNNNRPMTGREVYEEIINQGLETSCDYWPQKRPITSISMRLALHPERYERVDEHKKLFKMKEKIQIDEGEEEEIEIIRDTEDVIEEVEESEFLPGGKYYQH
ncbi:MAG: hypothetical protein V2A78_12700 [bacterium]